MRTLQPLRLSQRVRVIPIERAYERLLRMAQVALPQFDDEWGSERQIKAENEFFTAVSLLLDPTTFDELEGFCLKGTSADNVFEALRLAYVYLHKG